jgi:hypothetical protein
VRARQTSRKITSRKHSTRFPGAPLAFLRFCQVRQHYRRLLVATDSRKVGPGLDLTIRSATAYQRL